MSSWVDGGAIAEMHNTKKEASWGRNGNRSLGSVYVKLETPVKFQVSNWVFKFRRGKTTIWAPLTISTEKWYLKPGDWRTS